MGGSSSGLATILKKNPDCANLFGGLPAALKLLAAAQRGATDSPGWQMPGSFANPDKGPVVAGTVAANEAGTFAGVDFGTTGVFNAWNGKPFTVFTNANYSALKPSQRQTVFLHELHHVALGDTPASAALDAFGMTANVDFQDIVKKCRTAMPK